MNAQETAEYLGITVEELMYSFYRGLPPGTLGRRIDGELRWEPDDLLPPSEARQWGGPVPEGTYFRLDDSDALDRGRVIVSESPQIAEVASDEPGGSFLDRMTKKQIAEWAKREFGETVSTSQTKDQMIAEVDSLIEWSYLADKGDPEDD